MMKKNIFYLISLLIFSAIFIWRSQILDLYSDLFLPHKSSLVQLPVDTPPVRHNPESIELNKFQLIKPVGGDKLPNPFIARGYVPKNWLFEGQFNYVLKDLNGNTVSQGTIFADWNLPQETIPFTTEITYSSRSDSGLLIFKNDNPSGLPENEKFYSIPVKLIPVN